MHELELKKHKSLEEKLDYIQNENIYPKITETRSYKKYNGKEYWIHTYVLKKGGTKFEIATLDETNKISKQKSIEKELKYIRNRGW